MVISPDVGAVLQPSPDTLGSEATLQREQNPKVRAELMFVCAKQPKAS